MYNLFISFGKLVDSSLLGIALFKTSYILGKINKYLLKINNTKIKKKIYFSLKNNKLKNLI
jgi:hypothetical protein